jgi:glycosyltransferase involved in cell wall biosynthesis
MRIGIDCRLWNETGVGRYIRNLVAQLNEIDDRNVYTLFALSSHAKEIKNTVQKVKEKKWKVVTADIRWHSLKEQFLFPRILRKENLDLAHFPYFSAPIFYDLPFVVTIHDLIIHHFPTGQASTLPYPLYLLKFQGYKFVLSQIASKARMVLSVSQTTKREIIEHLQIPENKIVVTYEGVNVNFSHKAQSLEPLLKAQNFFLYVGNAYPHKNLDRLIEAFRLVKKKYPQVSLVVVGKNDFFYQRLRNEKKQVDDLKFLFNVTDAELNWLYQHAKALVLPSLMEGFGLPALEAMANNCVVLASNIPSLKEICDNAVVYFDPYSTADIAKRMEEICSIPLNHWDKYRQLGLERVKNFSWKKMAGQTLNVYEKCISAV